AGAMGTDGQLAPLPKAGGPARLANVAFRPNEPVEPAFDRRQALALHDGTIDPFFETVDVGALVRGASQRYEPGPGYHARSFTVSPQISEEFMNRGIHREYGVYLPAGYGTGRPWPLVTFLHGTSMNDGPSNHRYPALPPGPFA